MSPKQHGIVVKRLLQKGKYIEDDRRELIQENNKEVMQECTFKPNIKRMAPSLNTPRRDLKKFLAD